MTISWNDNKYTVTARLGTILHCGDRLCTFLYLAGAGYVGGMLACMAFTETLWLLLLAVPMLATTALFLFGYLRNPSRGLHLEWPAPRRTRRLKIINKRESHPTY